ncbi:MAG TPA: diaminopimelate decarboxylase [Luteibaculaceae bacterium]|nr:diaminopimelate decarboxylase [Luteibaculaceae bacterium]
MIGLKSKLGEWEKRSTPFYAYDLQVLRTTLQACKNSADKFGFHVHYAIKANARPEVVREISSLGFGADCVSGNEVQWALNHGFAPNKVVFAGVGKSDKEISGALDQQIHSFNCESLEELEVLNELAGLTGKKAPVALRINPNVNAQTHHYITTGLDENKFGINRQQLPELLDRLSQMAHIELVGLHFHIGSQINNLEVFKNLCLRVNEFVQWFEQRHISIKVINVGGGLGVDYDHPDQNEIPPFESYFELFDRFLERKPGQEVHFELGRSLVAQCGVLVSRVLYVKHGLKTKFVILDAGMTELLRPALYQAKHKIENWSVSPEQEPDVETYDVVGPVCESSDCFAKSIELPVTKRGDMVVIRTAGAYGEVMANSYNLRALEAPFFNG